MRKRNVILLIIAAVLAVGAVVGYVFYQRSAASPKSPVISFDEKELYVTTDATDEELLKGVTAADPEDGDVTDTLIVESVSGLINGNCVKVNYVAFDSKNHIGRAQRIVNYTDYKPPVFSMSHPMVFRKSSTVDILNYISAEDQFDGDISRKIIYSFTGSSTNFSTVGVHEVELRVSNSKGDTSHLTIEVEITENDPNAANIQLRQYLVYLSVGDEFRPEDYFKSYMLNEEPVTEMTNIRVENNVNTNEAGTYTVTYSLGYGTNRSVTKLIVVVE